MSLGILVNLSGYSFAVNRAALFDLVLLAGACLLVLTCSFTRRFLARSLPDVIKL